jgi:hypothetical protein
MFYFKSRDKARAFATKLGLAVTDRGTGVDKRWAVQVMVQEAA